MNLLAEGSFQVEENSINVILENKRTEAMSRLIVRTMLGLLLFIAVLFVAMLVSANTSITQRAIQAEIVINAPASKVWQVLIDFKAYPQWNPFIRQVTGTMEPDEQLTVQMYSGNRTISFSPTVLVVQPERELRWIGRVFIPGIFDGEHSFVIEPLGGNQVRLIQSEKFNGLLVPFSGSLLDDAKRSFQEMNRALKVQAEQAN